MNTLEILLTVFSFCFGYALGFYTGSILIKRMYSSEDNKKELEKMEEIRVRCDEKDFPWVLFKTTERFHRFRIVVCFGMTIYFYYPINHLTAAWLFDNFDFHGKIKEAGEICVQCEFKYNTKVYQNSKRHYENLERLDFLLKTTKTEREYYKRMVC